jgi:hypothetical protein
LTISSRIAINTVHEEVSVDNRQVGFGVIYGVHRVLEATSLGMEVIPKEIVSGEQNHAFIEFSRRTVRNGLSPSLSEREAGARSMTGLA